MITGKPYTSALLVGLALLPFSSRASVEVQCGPCSSERVASLHSLATKYLQFYQQYFSVNLSTRPLLIRVEHSNEEVWKTEGKVIQLSFDPSKTPAWVVDGILVHELGHWLVDQDSSNPFTELMSVIRVEADLDIEDTRWWNQGEGEREDGPHRGHIRKLREEQQNRSLVLTGCLDLSERGRYLAQYAALNELTADLLGVMYLNNPEAMRAVSLAKGSRDFEFRSFTQTLPNTPATFDRITDEYGYIDPHGVLSPSRSAIGKHLAPWTWSNSPLRAYAAIALTRRMQGIFFKRMRDCRIEDPQELNRLILLNLHE